MALLAAITVPLGTYMERVFTGKRTWLDPALRPAERGIYALCGVDATREQGWAGYAVNVLLLSAVSLLFTYAVLRLAEDLGARAATSPRRWPSIAARSTSRR